jgi:hypothetical protein
MTIHIDPQAKPSPERLASIQAELALERAKAQGLLQSLGYSSKAVPPALWHELTEHALRFQFLDKPNIYEVDGQASEQTLLHVLRFENPALTSHFISALSERYPDFMLRTVVQPVECLEYREVELTHRVRMTSRDVTRVVSCLFEVAHTYHAADYRWCLARERHGLSPLNIAFDTWPSRPKRTMRLRTEFLSDLILARLILAPYACRWTDVERQSLKANGEKTAVEGLDGNEAEFELADDQVTLDQLRWLLSNVTDMHVAAESLNYADRYTGERLHYEYLEQMTPSDDVLMKMRRTLANLRSFKDYADERFNELLVALDVGQAHDEGHGDGDGEPMSAAPVDDGGLEVGEDDAGR